MEVIRLVTELSQLPREAADLPESPVSGLPPLLTLDQLVEWTGYSRSHVNNYRKRTHDPLPTIGTTARPRFLPAEVLDWMRRENARSASDGD